MVSINIDLDASGASSTIERIRGELKSLEDDDLDFDLEKNFEGVNSQFDDIIDSVTDLRRQMKGLGDDLSASLAELDDASIDINTPSGDTGAVGGEADPPTTHVTVDNTIGEDGILSDGGDDGGLSANEFANKLNRLFRTREGGSLFRMEPDSPIGGPPRQSMVPGERGQFKQMEIDFLKDPKRVVDRNRFGGLDTQRMARLRRSAATDGIDFDTGNFARNVDIFGDEDGDMSFLRRVRRRMDDIDVTDLTEGMSRMGRIFSKFKPTMRKWWSLLAALIPLLIAVGVEAAGVASALGSIGIAGASIIGLGLIGHADSMKQSFAEAKQEIGDLKSDLFETFQPTAQLFAPIQGRFFDFVPGQMTGIADEMEGLVQFEGSIFRLFSHLTGGVEEFFSIINSNSGAISQVSERFGGLIGETLLDTFTFLINEVASDQQMLVRLGVALKNIAIIIFNLSKALGRVVATLSPVLGVLADLTGLLNNKAILSILTFFGATSLLAWGLTSLGTSALAAYAKLASLWTGSVYGSIISGIVTLQAEVAALITQYTALSGAAASAAAAIALTGVGALAVGGGLAIAGSMAATDFGSGGGRAGSPRPGVGGKQVYNDNRSFTFNTQGDMNSASEERIRDEIDKMNTEEQSMEPPEPGEGLDFSNGDGS